ncbi:MAG: nucleotidyltransferase family protein [Thermodesulfobacteriota bacterium]|nr:nucleotidyltransferase family protein [Thermodesulfobacteriota bacterium]
MHEKINAYELAGLKIHMQDMPEVLEKAIDKAFSLSRIESIDIDVTLRGKILEDNSFFKEMPLFISRKFQEISAGDDPMFLSRPDGKFALLAKGKESSSYAVCYPPFINIEMCCQKLTKISTPLIFQSVLIPVIGELLLKKGKLLMHAGCVGTPERDGILLLADSGGGKTTTAFSMAREGFSLISDDLVVASPTGNGIIFESIREKMNVSKKTIEFFPELSFLKKLLKQSREAKIPVDPREIFRPSRVIDFVRASAIIIVKIGKNGPKLVPVTGSAMLNPLLKSNTFARSESIAEKRIECVWRLLDQTIPYELVTGFDPDYLGRWMADKAATGSFGNPSASLLKTDNSEKLGRKKRSFTLKKAYHLSVAEKQFLLQTMLRHALDNVKVDKETLERFFDQATSPEFFSWMKYHRIEIILLKWLSGLNEDILQDITIDYKSKITEAVAHSIQMQSTAKKILSKLEKNGISAILLRGPGLALKYYPGTFLRYFRDVDIIVRREDLKTAEKILYNLGFCFEGEKDYWNKRGEWPFTDGRVTVELHWDAYPAICLKMYQSTNFWEETETIELDGFPIQSLSVNHLLLSSCLHFSWEHKLDRLVRLVDIRQIVKIDNDKIDWDWVVDFSLKSFQGFAAGQGFRFARELVGADIPDVVLSKLKANGFAEKIAYNVFPPKFLLSTPGRNSRFRRIIFYEILKNMKRISSN